MTQRLDYKALDIQAGNMASMIYADLHRIDDETPTVDDPVE